MRNRATRQHTGGFAGVKLFFGPICGRPDPSALILGRSAGVCADQLMEIREEFRDVFI